MIAGTDRSDVGSTWLDGDVDAAAQAFHERGAPFALATVIEVIGSASARCGAKAVFDANGRCSAGWVGGGCAEAHVGNESRAAIEERRPRIVEADLDDEIFGLGMPCGGRMRVFIEPQLPKPLISLSVAPGDEALAHHLAGKANCRAQVTAVPPLIAPRERSADLIKQIAIARASSRASASNKTTSERDIATLRPLAEVRSIRSNHAHDAEPIARPTELLLLGKSQITAELASLGRLLGWSVRAYAPQYTESNDTTLSAEKDASCTDVITCVRATPGFENLSIKAGSAVVIASHHKGDPEYLERAIAADAAWIGLVASAKRSRLVLDAVPDALQNPRVHAPAGLDLGWDTPFDIALSIIAHIIAPDLADHAGERVDLTPGAVAATPFSSSMSVSASIPSSMSTLPEAP